MMCFNVLVNYPMDMVGNQRTQVWHWCTDQWLTRQIPYSSMTPNVSLSTPILFEADLMWQMGDQQRLNILTTGWPTNLTILTNGWLTNNWISALTQHPWRFLSTPAPTETALMCLYLDILINGWPAKLGTHPRYLTYFCPPLHPLKQLWCT